MPGLTCPNCNGPLLPDQPCAICAAGERMYDKARARGMVRRPPKRLVNRQGMDLGLKNYLTGQDAALPPSDRTETE